ncbi:cytochrome b/b6 domain-containing protein [Methyloversatilis thermotolerans]|uniref:cytochrome b/b6 domain-containing protein n=1 Tax=Methyloversatilis thermotolerans TaxID=1346290 RepID=UPI000371A059|nr:cytochrome b/b6 domain-containing protein [Methyloversatilis thermotolerans]
MNACVESMRATPLRRLIHGVLALAVVFQIFSPEWMNEPWRTGDAVGRLMFALHEWGGLIAGLSGLCVAAGMGRRYLRGETPRTDRASLLAQFRLLMSGLLRLRVPPAPATRALAHLVQLLGLLLIAWFCLTGAAIWWVGAASATARGIGELHEMAAPLLYLYLGGHGGMALLHRLSARPLQQSGPVH